MPERWSINEIVPIETGTTLPAMGIRTDHPLPIELSVPFPDHHWCGYVGVPPGHPLHGVTLDESCKALRAAFEKAKEGPLGKRGLIPVFLSGGEPTPDVVFDVHGSITFSGQIPEAIVALDHWWFGFDCMHHDDMDNPKDLAFVEAECRSLAAQIVAIFPIEPQP